MYQGRPALIGTRGVDSSGSVIHAEVVRAAVRKDGDNAVLCRRVSPLYRHHRAALHRRQYPQCYG